MIQAWSFWLAWAIIAIGIVMLIRWNRAERKRERDEWLSHRRLMAELRAQRFRDMTGQ